MEYTVDVPDGQPGRGSTPTKLPTALRPHAADSPLADFLRYHVLIRVFHGRTRDWLQILQNTGRGGSRDAQFLRWLQRRLDTDPLLLDQIRDTVNACGLWPTDE
jgi:hypothetical protein